VRPARVDHARLFALVLENVGTFPDRDDLPVADRHRFRGAELRVHGQHLAVVDDQVGGVVGCARTNEAGTSSRSAAVRVESFIWDSESRCRGSDGPRVGGCEGQQIPRPGAPRNGRDRGFRVE